MTATVSANYTAVNNLLNRTPVYKARFAGLGQQFSTHKVFDFKAELLTDGPKLYARLGETTGAAAPTDSSGNGNVGVYVNNPSLGVPGLIVNSSNLALQFNGTSQFVGFTDTAALHLSSLTVGFHMTLDAAGLGSARVLAAKWDQGSNQRSWAVAITAGNVLQVSADKTGDFSVNGSITSSTVLAAGVTYHIVVTFFGPVISLYLNGVLDTTGVAVVPFAASTAPVWLGRDGNGGLGSNMYGVLDEFVIYAGAVSASRIATWYASSTGRYGGKNYMTLPACTAAEIHPESGSSSLGTATFSLMDINNEITAVLSTLNGALVTMFGGYDGLDESDYAPIFTGIVTDAVMNDDLTGYEITCGDLQVLTNKQFCQVASSTLTAAMSAISSDQYTHYARFDAQPGVTPGDYVITNFLNDTDFGVYLTALYGVHWSYYQTTVFTNGLTINLPDTSGFLSTGYILIDNEILSYTVTSGTTMSSTRGALGTTVVAHAVGAKATELIRLTGHPMDIFLSALTNTNKTGLSIPTSQIDTAAIAALRASIGSTPTMDFRITAALNAKTFFEQEIFSVLAAYLRLTADGRISVKQFAAPVSSVATITHANIRTEGDGDNEKMVIGWQGNFNSILNSVQFQYDFDPQTNKYNTTSPAYTDAASIARYGLYPLVIKSQGYRSTAVGTTALQSAVAALVLGRYSSGGAPIVPVSVFLSKWIVEPGDIVALTTDKLPNKSTATRGLNGALLEVINRAPDFANGAVSLQLLFTSWNL